MGEKRHQVIYDRIDEEFKSFVDNNRRLFKKMSYDGITDVRQVHKDDKLNSTNLLNEPFNVAYVGLTDCGEGSLIAFLDESFNKIYVKYYDVG